MHMSGVSPCYTKPMPSLWPPLSPAHMMATAAAMGYRDDDGDGDIDSDGNGNGDGDGNDGGDGDGDWLW